MVYWPFLNHELIVILPMKAPIVNKKTESTKSATGKSSTDQGTEELSSPKVLEKINVRLNV